MKTYKILNEENVKRNIQKCSDYFAQSQKMQNLVKEYEQADSKMQDDSLPEEVWDTLADTTDRIEEEALSLILSYSKDYTEKGVFIARNIFFTILNNIHP